MACRWVGSAVRALAKSLIDIRSKNLYAKLDVAITVIRNVKFFLNFHCVDHVIYIQK